MNAAGKVTFLNFLCWEYMVYPHRAAINVAGRIFLSIFVMPFFGKLQRKIKREINRHAQSHTFKQSTQSWLNCLSSRFPDCLRERKVGGEWGGPFSQDFNVDDSQQLLLLIWHFPFIQHWTSFNLLSKQNSYSWLALKIWRPAFWEGLQDAYKTTMLGQKSRKI